MPEKIKAESISAEFFSLINRLYFFIITNLKLCSLKYFVKFFKLAKQVFKLLDS